MGDSVHQRIVVKACELNAQARIPLIDKVKSKSVTLTFGYLPDGEPTVLFTPNAYGQEKDSPILATGYALVVGGDHQIIYRE